MQKRVLSFLLVLCMLLAVVPALVLPLAAAEGDVTIRFVDANANPSTTTSEQTVSGTELDFDIPTVPADAFGWYEITPAGAIRKAETYLGETVTDNLTFYLLKKTSAFNGASNWPIYTANTSLDGWAGGWTAGSYINNTYTLFTTVDQWNILNNGSTWGNGGIYLNGDSGKRMITTTNGMLTLSYNAPISGLIDVDFDDLSVNFTGDGNAMSDFALAIAVNGVVVWPQTAAGSLVRNDSVIASGITTYPYWNNDNISLASYSSSHTTNWLYLSASGNITPENDTKLATLKNLVPEDEDGWKKYIGNETSWKNAEDTALAARNAITDTGSDAYNAADAAYRAAKTEHERWTTVKNNCLTVSDYVKTGSMLSQYETYCSTNNDAPHDIAVTAGDRVDIVVGKVNSPHVTVWPKVTYTKFAGVDLVEEGNVLSYTYSDYDLVQGGKNWPVAEKDTGNSYTLTQNFGNGWAFVQYNDGTVNIPTYDSRYFTFGGWPDGILWAGDGRIARTADVNVKDKKTNGVGFQYAPDAAGTLNMSFSFTTPAASESAPVYLAIYQYSADGATKTLITPTAAPGATDCDAETEGDGIKYTTTSSHVVTLSGVTLAKGDKLVFVWRNAASETADGYSASAYAQYFTFRVTYTAGGPTTSTTYDPRGNYNAPVFDFSTGAYGNKLTYTGGWDLVAHNDTSTYDTADVIDTFMYGEGERWFSTGCYGSSVWDSKSESKAFVYVHDTNIRSDMGWPNPWGVFPMLGATGGWRYTADGAGTINLDLTKLRSQNNGNDKEHPGDHGYIAVFKNGKMIWPMAEGTDTNYYGETYEVTVGEGEGADTKTYHSAKWAKIGSYKTNLTAAQIAALQVVDGSAKTGSLTGITVNYGDEIEILVRNDNTATNFWNDESCGFTLTADVTYTEKTLKSYFSTSRYDQTIPAAPEAITAGEDGYTAADIAKFNYYYQPIFTDNAWSFVAYPGKNVTAENARTDFYAMNRNPGTANGGNANSDPATGWGDTFWGLPITSTWNDWGNALSPHFRIIGGGDWGATGSVAPGTNSYGGYRYTAPLAGRVDIDVTKLLTIAGDKKDANAVEVAIYIDQQKVWPAGDAWFVLAECGVDYTTAARDSINGTLHDVVVGKGSTIEFLARTGEATSTWTARGTVFEGAVSYTEWWDVNVTASVSMFDNLSVDVVATTSVVDPTTLHCTLTSGGKVAAKDVAKDIHYHITGTLEGETVTLAAGTTRISDLLYEYVGSDSEETSAMAVSILNYTTAAQKYFTPTLTDDQLANAALTDEQKTVTVQGTAENYDTASAYEVFYEPSVTMVGMSLILEDSPRFKLLFTGPAPDEGCDYILSTKKEDDLSNEDVPIAIYSATATADGKAYKAITDGIPVTAYNSTYVFEVELRRSNDNKEAVSYGLYYSIANYCWAMKDDAEVGAVAKAMLAMFECANQL